MKKSDFKAIACEQCDKFAEQIRCNYAHSLKMYLQLYNKYKQIKTITTIEGGELKKHFKIVDQYFYNKSGKLNWDIISLMLPPNFEGRLKKEYKTLNENEIRLCCLIFFNVPNKIISDILPYTQDSVRTIASQVRKKVEMSDIKSRLKDIMIETIFE